MGERGHTGRWSAEQAKGWGRELCIVDADGAVIFRPVKPKAYYTDYAPGREPGSVLLSDDIARKQGRYVATPEIKAEIDAEEAKRAFMAAAAPDMFEAGIRLWCREHMPHDDARAQEIAEEYDA